MFLVNFLCKEKGKLLKVSKIRNLLYISQNQTEYKQLENKLLRFTLNLENLESSCKDATVGLKVEGKTTPTKIPKLPIEFQILKENDNHPTTLPYLDLPWARTSTEKLRGSVIQ